jgi:hypothetical protein
MADSKDEAAAGASPGSQQRERGERERMRAAALRANLKRRKTQARVRADAEESGPMRDPDA